MQTIFQTIFSFRFILINAGVFAYFLWVQPVLLGMLQQSPSQPNMPTGLALMAIQILNLFAILYKGPFLQQRTQGQGSIGVGFILVSLAALCYVGLVSPLANWIILELLGIEIRGTPPFWQGLFGFMYLFAMLILNTWLMLASVFPFLGKIEIPQRFDVGEKYPLAVEWLADIFLAAFSVTAYTMLWEKLAASTPFTATTLQNTFMEYFGAVVFFCMVYPATNVLAFADDWLAKRPMWARLLSVAIFIIIMLTAINNIPRAALQP